MFTTSASVFLCTERKWEQTHTHSSSQVPLPAHTAIRRTSTMVCCTGHSSPADLVHNPTILTKIFLWNIQIYKNVERTR